MRKFLVLLFLASSGGYSQFVANKTFHDFGDVTEDSSRTVDFILTNKYADNATPNVLGFDFDVSSRQWPYYIATDSTCILRLKLCPDKKGPIEKEVHIGCWGCPDTLTITLKANVKSWSYKTNKAPDPIERPMESNEETRRKTPVRLLFIDAETKKPIKGLSVSFDRTLEPWVSNETDENGELFKELQIGYRVTIFDYRYEYYKGIIYPGCEDSLRVVELKRNAGINENGNFEFSSFTSGNRVTPDKAKEEAAKVFKDIQDSIVHKPLDENFKTNSVVFLMDVSFSMIEEDRLDLLKTSLEKMINILRPEDQVSFITFASETKVLFQPMKATPENKKYMIRKVKALKPEGLTNGGKGFKTSYKFIKDNYVEDGNNQLIVATDGGLNEYMRHDALIKLVEKNAEDTRTSILMIHGYEYAYSFMDEIAKAGDGHLLPINTDEDSEDILIKEIKLNSKKETTSENPE